MNLTDIVVADASPLIIAVHTNLLMSLPVLLGSIYIPPAVAEECMRPNKRNAKVIEEAITSNVLTVSGKTEHDFLSRIPQGIDAGEAEAIALALNLKARLLIDDRKGRKIARHEGLSILGFGAVLVKAKHAGVIDKVVPVIRKMEAMHYHISERVVSEIIQLCGE
jgi:hypothetical protein